MKWYVVSLTKSVKADNETEALAEFDRIIKEGAYDNGSVDIEETTKKDA